MQSQHMCVFPSLNTCVYELVWHADMLTWSRAQSTNTCHLHSTSWQAQAPCIITMAPSNVEGRPLAAHSSSTHDRSEEALLEGGPLAGHGSSTRAFEETVLESRPLAAHSTKSMKVKLNRPVLTAVEKKERQRAQARARKAKFRSDPEKLEREKKRRQEQRSNKVKVHKCAGQSNYFKTVGAKLLRESGCTLFISASIIPPVSGSCSNSSIFSITD